MQQLEHCAWFPIDVKAHTLFHARQGHDEVRVVINKGTTSVTGSSARHLRRSRTFGWRWSWDEYYDDGNDEDNNDDDDCDDDNDNDDDEDDGDDDDTDEDDLCLFDSPITELILLGSPSILLTYYLGYQLVVS